MRQVSDEHWNALILIIRLFTKASSENAILRGILTKSEFMGKPPLGWSQFLEKAVNSPEYANVLQMTEKLIESFEQENPDTRLIELISKMRPPDYN